MKDEINLKRILENKNFVFISPHLDDAVFSCGALLAKLEKLKKKVFVITVFTKANSQPYSPQAQKFLEACEYKDAQKLFEDRKKEDIRAMKFFKARYLHLDFVDAAWRRKNGNFIYRDEKSQFSGKIAASDQALISQIADKIRPFVSRGGKTLVLAPLGVGGHADHVIVREVVQKLGMPALFWEDFPYNHSQKSIDQYFQKNKSITKMFEYCDYQSFTKERVIRLYKTQFRGLFPSGRIPEIPERYYISR